MALMTDRRTWLWVAVILGAGALVSSLSLSRGDADVAAFVGLSAFSGALAIAMRGCSPDERILLAEMRAAERASWRKRATCAESALRDASRTLTATLRPVRVFSASQTEPMPPAPSIRRSR